MDDYRDSHRDPSKPASYDPQFFEPGTTLNLMWEIEREIIGNAVSRMSPKPQRALDFACGTGRILSEVARWVPEVVGVDVSSAMIEIARSRCPNTTIIEADLTADPDVISDRFDLITSFRFLLNAQPDLRSAALRALRSRICNGGLLLTNFHLNPMSLTGVYHAAMSRIRGIEPRTMMTLGEARQLLRENGFEPVDVRGYGYLLYRKKRPRFVASVGAVERKLAAWNTVPALAQNFIISARPAPISITSPG